MNSLFSLLIWAVLALAAAAYKNGEGDTEKTEVTRAFRALGKSFQEAALDREEPPAKTVPAPWDAVAGPDREAGHYFSADEGGEGHVASVGLSREKQLEQLEVLKRAGLLDEDEYKQRKQKIKRG